MNKHNKNFWMRHPFWASICASIMASLIIGVAGFFINSAISIKPELESLEKQIVSLNDNLRELKKGTDVVEHHIIQRPVKGISCKVGTNVYLKGYMASVYANNPFGLKQQECIELTYKKGFVTVSISVMVDVIANTSNNNSNADIFLGTECLESMGISKKEQNNTGVFNMSYKYIVKKK